MINASSYNNFYEFHRASGLDCIASSHEWMKVVFAIISRKREEKLREAVLEQARAKKRKEVANLDK